MVRCHVCGQDEQMPYRCSYCGNPHCGDHRLPESHMCPERHQAAMARLHRELTGDPGVEVKNRGWSGRGAGHGRSGSGWSKSLGPLEGNVALYTLGLIVGVFVLELVVQQSWGTEAFRTLFVLDSNWLSKPWTLVTSVFAHAGLSHLLFNGIVLFFFGPLLEKRIGSRRFVALILGGGILAGLAQIGFYATIAGGSKGVVGISGALMAILGTLTILGPRLTVLLFFVIPTPLWVLTIGYALFDLLGMIGGTIEGGSIAHTAHLAGLVVGVVAGFRLRDEGYAFPGRQGRIDLGPGGL